MAGKIIDMRHVSILLGLLMPLSANAADSGFYAGVMAGVGIIDHSGPEANGIPRGPFGDTGTDNPYRFLFPPPGAESFVEWGPIAGRVEEDGLAWGVVAGYRFTPRLGVEATWVDFAVRAERHEQHFSNANVRFDFPAVRGRNIADLDVPVQGAKLSGAFTWPLNDRVAVSTRVGALFWDADLDITQAQSEITIAPEVPPTFVSRIIDRSRTLRFRVDDDGISPALGTGLTYRLLDRLHLRGDYDFYHGVAGDDVHTVQAGLQYEF